MWRELVDSLHLGSRETGSFLAEARTSAQAMAFRDPSPRPFRNQLLRELELQKRDCNRRALQELVQESWPRMNTDKHGLWGEPRR